jgi:ubiquinone/menaquinone biosynthesis C-methylase UbiE
MKLADWQTNWDELGKDDPLWVVLTDPAKKGGRWQPAEFFETGREEISEVLTTLRSRKVELRLDKALDFGCGVGRLSQALAEHFGEVHGIDISPSMIGHAKSFNRHPERCFFHLNASNELGMFEDNSFDFVYSNIALQHIEPRYSKRYLKEFLRVLKPGGATVFQLLSGRSWRGFVPELAVAWYRKAKHRGQAFIGMFGIPENEVRRIIAEAGGRISHVEHSPLDHRWMSHRFYVTKG